MTSVIAVPETGSAAKGHRVGSRAVRVRLLSERRSHLGGRPVAAGLCAAFGHYSCNQQDTVDAPHPQLCTAAAPPFLPLGKTPVGPVRPTIPLTRPPPCWLPSQPLPPTTFSSVRDTASLNLAKPPGQETSCPACSLASRADTSIAPESP